MQNFSESTNDAEDDKDRFATTLEKRLKQLASPFTTFVETQTLGSIILIACTFLALLLANSPWRDGYEQVLHMKAALSVGNWSIDNSLQHWVNEALMALFFFVIGLEIKRELLVGELRQLKKSVPIIAAALGGMLFPAAIYSAFNIGGEAAHGWGIPMATDIAFAVGILALLRDRVPTGVSIFITAMAILDDLGAILVISLFYSQDIHWQALIAAAVLLGVLVLCNLGGVRRNAVYWLLGLLVWLALHYSGVHTTVAGVLVAMTVPARPRHGPAWFVRQNQRLIEEFSRLEQRKQSSDSILAQDDQHAVVDEMRELARKAGTPLQLWESGLDQPVALLVLPLFALCNAGILLNPATFTDIFTHAAGIGIVAGLLLGKTLGITSFCWLALKFGWGQLPDSMRFGHVLGIGLLGGMGFTMSIFIANLGLSSTPELLHTAKAAVLFSTLVAGIGGLLLLARVSRRQSD